MKEFMETLSHRVLPPYKGPICFNPISLKHEIPSASRAVRLPQVQNTFFFVLLLERLPLTT